MIIFVNIFGCRKSFAIGLLFTTFRVWVLVSAVFGICYFPAKDLHASGCPEHVEILGCLLNRLWSNEHLMHGEAHVISLKRFLPSCWIDMHFTPQKSQCWPFGLIFMNFCDQRNMDKSFFFFSLKIRSCHRLLFGGM